MTLHALDAIGEALTATRRYRPRGIGEWLWLVLVTIFVGGAGIGVPTSGGGQGLTPQQRSALDGTVPPAVIDAVIVIVAVVLVLWAIAVAVGAFLEFPFLRWLRTGEVATVETIRTHWGQAIGLAIFRLVVGSLGFALAGAILFATAGARATPIQYLAALADLGVVFGLIGLPTGVVVAFTTAFVVPTMVLEGTGVLAGWRRFWGTLAGAPKQFLAYAIAVAVLGYAAGLAVVLLAVVLAIPFVIIGAIVGIAGAAAGLGWLPVVAVAVLGGVVLAVFLLAAFALVQVFLRYYALLVLGAVDTDLDFIPERRRALRGGEETTAGPDDPGSQLA